MHRLAEMKIKWRFVVFVQLFLACFMCYMFRMNVNIAINAMTVRLPPRKGSESCNPELKKSAERAVYTETTYSEELNGPLSLQLRKAYDKDNIEDFVPDSYKNDSIYLENVDKLNPNYGPRYVWTQPETGMVLGSYYWGLCLGSVLGGMATEYFPVTHVVGISTAISFTATALVPVGAKIHWTVVVALRILVGFMSGFCLPGVQALIAVWSPPEERSFFVSSIMGCTMGTIITSALSGVIIKGWSWMASFYVTGVIGLLWTVSWYFTVTTSPENHMFISEEEKAMIIEATSTSKKEKLTPPMVEILKNCPFWALVFLQFGSLWGFITTMTLTPKFMSEILGYDIKSSGFISALPHLMRFMFGIGFGFFGDWARKRACMSSTRLVKTLTITSHIIPSFFILSIVFAGCNKNAIVSFLVISLGFNGSCVCTTLKNPHDIGPRFAGAIYGVMGTVAAFSGIISPQINAALTKKNNTMSNWHYNFIIGAAMYFVSAVVFIFFGSGEIQPFNEIIVKRE